MVGYYQWGQKVQPTRLPFGTYFYDSAEETFAQDSGSWVSKGEWNGTISNNLYVESRYGVFGYYFPLIANTPEGSSYFARDSGLTELEGGNQRQQLDRDREQATAAATYFKDNFLGGSHSVKFGGEVLIETGFEGYLQAVDGHSSTSSTTTRRSRSSSISPPRPRSTASPHETAACCRLRSSIT
jgi:hypothetical protein